MPVRHLPADVVRCEEVANLCSHRCLPKDATLAYAAFAPASCIGIHQCRHGYDVPGRRMCCGCLEHVLCRSQTAGMPTSSEHYHLTHRSFWLTQDKDVVQQPTSSRVRAVGPAYM